LLFDEKLLACLRKGNLRMLEFTLQLPILIVAIFLAARLRR
jgi:hypothetical protein